MDVAHTLVAVATAPGHAGVGVVRISGPLAHTVAQGVLGRVPKPRQALFAAFADASGREIDRGVAIWFAAPASYTGEDTLELQAHGNPLILAALVRRCVELGAEPAGPGEFTQRAFLNGKLSLDQAEAVADLIAADSDAAVAAARRSLAGEFAATVDALADELLTVRALVEASLDFPEEGDIDWLQRLDLLPRLHVVQARLADALAAARRGMRLREGYRVVIVGRPNVGKSTLLNALAGEEVAITSPIAGTTRDALRAHLQIDGVPIEVTDTAGLRDTDDPVERIGIERARAALARADLALWLVDEREVAAEDSALMRELPAALPRLVVRSKADVAGGATAGTAGGGPSADSAGSSAAAGPLQANLAVSAVRGEGLPALRAAILRQLDWRTDASPIIARERHVAALEQAAGHLAAALDSVAAPDLLAEELRLAGDALGSVTGRVVADDLLGEIFGRFCIGK
ncbi:MAG: tRNA uridine-5-carboxymethylaminomethyl(34) synthesis GTPase MnmE [Rhodocyclaceae bacterium]|nr:tRNA uridine-5-carboxymethylaminomethyl(34) synthesis GTPase MnmE [Rhodocyclaceae bacterium]